MYNGWIIRSLWYQMESLPASIIVTLALSGFRRTAASKVLRLPQKYSGTSGTESVMIGTFTQLLVLSRSKKNITVVAV